MLKSWSFDIEEEASQLLAAFQANRTITDLTELSASSLGCSFSEILQNMP
jgi:hypothetical protein